MNAPWRLLIPLVITGAVLSQENDTSLIFRSAVHTSYSDFHVIAKTAAYVDKTLMLEVLFQVPEYCLVTAPRRFGKTTNLNMVKTFLELESDANGQPVTSCDYLRSSVNDTPNYRLFVANKMLITEKVDFMTNHFGKYPVIMVSFTTSRPIRSYNEAVSFLRIVIHRSFLPHRYLVHSPHLTVVEKSICEMWCDEKSYRLTDVDFLVEALSDLSRYLSRHFYGSKCYVLMDEYDELVSKTVLGADKGDDLKHVIGLLVEIMATLLTHNLYVARCLITGVSYITGEELMGMNEFYAYRFLDNHPFVKYFGVTSVETERLFRSKVFGLTEHQINTAYALYNGYTSRDGIKIYNLYSIVRFLQMKSAKPYWTYFANIENLENALKIPVLRTRIINLIMGKTIIIEVKEKFTMKDVVKLRQLVVGSWDDKPISSDLFFTYILEHGYLTYVPSKYTANGCAVSLSSREVAREIHTRVEEYYSDTCRFDKELMTFCIMFFDGISANTSNDDLVFVEALNNFHVTLEGLFEGFSNEECVPKMTEMELHLLIALLLCKTKYILFDELRYSYWDSYFYKTIIPDVVLVEPDTNFAIIVEFKMRQRGYMVTSKSGLKQILEKEYFRIFRCDELARFNIRNFMFIGLAIDSQLKPYLSVLANSCDLKQAIHLEAKQNPSVQRQGVARCPKKTSSTLRKRTYRPRRRKDTR